MNPSRSKRVLPLVFVTFSALAQSVSGVCTGTATPCGELYSSAICSGDETCDAALDSCGGICERNGVKGYKSLCQCTETLLSCEDSECSHQISCEGIATCSDLKRKECQVTAGCKWLSPSEKLWWADSSAKEEETTPAQQATDAPTDAPTEIVTAYDLDMTEATSAPKADPPQDDTETLGQWWSDGGTVENAESAPSSASETDIPTATPLTDPPQQPTSTPTTETTTEGTNIPGLTISTGSPGSSIDDAVVSTSIPSAADEAVTSIPLTDGIESETAIPTGMATESTTLTLEIPETETTSIPSSTGEDVELSTSTPATDMPDSTTSDLDVIIKECPFSLGNDPATCAALIATTDEECDCYTFCDNELVVCSNFESTARQSFFCTGAAVVGCTTAQAGATTAAPTMAPTEESSSLDEEEEIDVDRVDNVRDYLIAQNVSSEEDLTAPLSPQRLALSFIATDDELQLDVPEGDIDTPEGYEFVTRYVLALLYYATDGDLWTYDLNFLEPFSVCFWYSVLQYPDLSTEFRGVACSENGTEVVALFLTENNIQGELPEELSLLTTITNIDFDSNGFVGSIPKSYEALSNMENFFVSQNELTGSFPEWVDSWAAIKNINVAGNQFNGTIPASIGNLEQLEGIALDNNLFTGSLEGMFDTAFIPGLRNLSQFYAENNRLTGILGEGFMRGMDMLEFLDVSDNVIEGNISAGLFELPNLVVLDLHDNDFDTLPDEFPMNSKLAMLALQKCQFANQMIPASVSNLVALQHLDLSQNQFTGFMPPTIGGMTNLTYLFLSQNDFAPGPIPAWIQELDSLEELSLKSTKRTGTIPFDLGDSLPELILLDLDNNFLEGKIPESLGTLSNLHVLLLNRNNLTSVIPDTFAGLENLKLIFLDANTEITGDLDSLFCENPSFLTKPVIVADCDQCNETFDDECCTLCCSDGEECNPGVHVPDLDPIWQLGYDRVFFTVGREDYFPKEEYLDGDEGNTTVSVQNLTSSNITSIVKGHPSFYGFRKLDELSWHH